MLNTLAQRIHDNAVAKGFWKANQDDGMKLMLIVSELAEALEELRKGYGVQLVYYTEEAPTKPEGFGVELADAIIRILDLCAWHRIDIDALVEMKMAYNETRPHMHGRTV